MGAEECSVVTLGDQGRAAIAQYVSLDEMGIEGALRRARWSAPLFFRITSSCSLTGYLSDSMADKHLEIPPELLTPIVAFHGGITLNALKHFTKADFEAKADELEVLTKTMTDGAYELFEATLWPG